MSKQTAAASYKSAEILGRSQIDLILTVYDGALQGLNEVEKKFTAKKPKDASTELEMVRKCVTHLYTTLDMEKGEEISEQLAALYVFILNKLDEIESTKDLVAIEAITKILKNLREGWAELKEQNQQGQETLAKRAAQAEEITEKLEHSITV